MKMYYYRMSITSDITHGKLGYHRSTMAIDLGCKPHLLWPNCRLKNETKISMHDTNALAALHN